jgi:hypothetical protein
LEYVGENTRISSPTSQQMLKQNVRASLDPDVITKLSGVREREYALLRVDDHSARRLLLPFAASYARVGV